LVVTADFLSPFLCGDNYKAEFKHFFAIRVPENLSHLPVQRLLQCRFVHLTCHIPMIRPCCQLFSNDPT
jgi:hypothetical protein